MDIRKLHIFQTAAQMKSFTKAAAALYMTQPPVSYTHLDVYKRQAFMYGHIRPGGYIRLLHIIILLEAQKHKL